MLHGDSPSYFPSSSAIRYRTLGYPAFLQAVLIVTQTLEAVPRIQVLLLAASVVFMGWAVGRALGGRPAWTVALVVIVLGLSTVPRFHAYVLSEGLFVPLSCVVAGLLVLFLAKPTPWLATGLASALGIAVTVRPSGLFFAVAGPFVLWLVWDRCKGTRWRITVAAALPMIVIVAAEQVGRGFVENASRGTPAGAMHRRIFSKAVMIKSEPVLPGRVQRDAPLAAFVAEARASAAPLRDLVQRSPDWRIRAVLLRNAEAAGEFPRYWREIGWRAADLGEVRGKTGEALVGELGRTMLLSRPDEWAANAILHWRALWFLYSINDAGLTARHASLVEGMEHDPVFQEAAVVAPVAVRPEAPWIVFGGRLGALASLLASAAAVVLCVAERFRLEPRRRDAGLAAAAATSLMAHCYMFGIAVVAHAHLRYAVAIWPLQAVYCTLVARWAACRWTDRRRRTAANAPHLPTPATAINAR